ncbi:MAG: NADAR family protein [Flavobacteriales bacterium]|nr:NADAR family protein [Flavobacteriales bacterium]
MNKEKDRFHLKQEYLKSHVFYGLKGHHIEGWTEEEFKIILKRVEKLKLGVYGLEYRSSEALYQACRFPDFPEIQEIVREQKSPMAAKMVTKPHRKDKCREDWDNVRLDIMRWVLRVKLSCNFKQMGAYLNASNNDKFINKSIVEISTKRDKFWGTVDDGNGNLEGENMMGLLLMELRKEYFEKGEEMKLVEFPNIPNFKFPKK